MRFVIVCLYVLCLWAPAPVAAGAWMREVGTTFTSTSFTVNYFRDTASSTYIEHGLRDDLTLGLDVGYYTSRFGVQSGIATVFMRRPLGPNTGKNKWAYEVGLGSGWIGELVLPHAKAGLSWGRGYKLGDRYGWMAVDASVTMDITYGQRLYKVDSTVGLGITDTTKGVMQLYLTQLNGALFGTIAPSLIYTPPQKKFSIQIGAESPINGWDDTAIKIGFWRTF